MQRIGAFALSALLSLPAMAQATVEVIPPNPTSDSVVKLLVLAPNIVNDADVTRVDNHFRVDLFTCNITCVSVGRADVVLASFPLSAGNYTYEIHIDEDPTPSASGAFVVTQAELVGAPTLSPAALLALSLVLGAAGFAFIGRRS